MNDYREIMAKRRLFRAPLDTWPGGSHMWVAGSKQWVDPLNMRVEDIEIEDIALALSNICRYTGHVQHPLTVAEHSVKVASRLANVRRYGVGDINAQLAGLLHDAAEAYISDIPKPIKDDPRMAWLREYEDHLMGLIYQRFKVTITPEVEAAVKQADKDEFTAEWATEGGDHNHQSAYRLFMARFQWLMRERTLGHHRDLTAVPMSRLEY